MSEKLVDSIGGWEFGKENRCRGGGRGYFE